MHQLRLLVFSPYFAPHVGGLESYVSDLDDVLLRFGEVDAITVFTPQLPPESPPLERRVGGQLVVRFPAFELIPNFPVPKIWSRAFWSALRSTRPRSHDVFVSHTRFFLSSMFALGAARALRRPLLHVEHGSDYVQLNRRAPRAAARIYDRVLGRLLLRHADRVIAISHAAAAFVYRLARRESTVVHRGMWIERLDAAPPDEGVRDWAAPRAIVTFVGRLIDGKGVADLLNAFARLTGEPAVLCIVGDGPRRTELELLAERLEITPRVRFLGYLPEERAWGVMRSSDIVVNPSYTEGLPTSVLEAALMGKAVLATDVGGTREIVANREGGLLVEPHDIDGLRSCLDQLLADADLRAGLGSVARADTAGRFDWNVSAAHFLAVAWELTSS